jgi:hypothetical protein
VTHPIPPPRPEAQQIRRALFTVLGELGEVADALKAMSVAARLAHEKLDAARAVLARCATRVGEPEEEEEQ